MGTEFTEVQSPRSARIAEIEAHRKGVHADADRAVDAMIASVDEDGGTVHQMAVVLSDRTIGQMIADAIDDELVVRLAEKIGLLFDDEEELTTLQLFSTIFRIIGPLASAGIGGMLDETGDLRQFMLSMKTQEAALGALAMRLVHYAKDLDKLAVEQAHAVAKKSMLAAMAEAIAEDNDDMEV